MRRIDALLTLALSAALTLALGGTCGTSEEDTGDTSGEDTSDTSEKDTMVVGLMVAAFASSLFCGAFDVPLGWPSIGAGFFVLAVVAVFAARLGGSDHETTITCRSDQNRRDHTWC